MDKNNRQICVAGLGYIGLPTAAMLASRGYDVVGFDTNAKVVEAINQGIPHFHEPDLQMLLQAAISTGRLRATNEPEPADYFIIAVPTPIKGDNRPELKHVDAVCDLLAPQLVAGNSIILESTSPVGTTEIIAERIGKLRPDLQMPEYKNTEQTPDIFISHCPERVLPGKMLTELVSNDRIVGGISQACADSANALYESFVQGELFVTDSRTAEFVKLIENAYRDVNIAFANELSLMCDKFGIDVWNAIALANRHPRVNILQPGPGVGGHCIAIDPWFLVAGAPDLSPLIQAARAVNDNKPDWVVERLRGFTSKLKAPKVACYGLAYKPDVDDLRESPAVEIVLSLASDPGLHVVVCEPNIKDLPDALASLPNVELVNAQTARDSADVVAFLVAHKEFRAIEPNEFLNKMVLDTVGLLNR